MAPTADPPRVRSAGFWILFAACFALRVGLIAGRDVPGELERMHGARFGYEMNRAALAVMKTGSIRDVFADGSGPSAHVSPAYPYLLGGVYRLVGPDPRRMRLAQCLLSAGIAALAIALLPMVGRRLGLHPLAGALASLAMAANLFDLGLETHGEWEQPLAALTLLLVVLDAANARDDGWRSTAGAARSGLLLGWSALLSPSVALAAGLIPIGEFLIRPGDRGRIARSFAIRGAVLLACLAPWAARNARDLGGLVPLRSNFGLEISLVCHDSTSGYLDDQALDRHPLTSNRELAEYERQGELPYMKAKLGQARAWIAAHPGRYARQTGLRAFQFWFVPVPPWVRYGGPTLNRIYHLFAWEIGAINGLAMIGLARLWIRRHPSRVILAAGLFGPTSIYSLVQVIARYGYPARPIADLLAMDLVVGVFLAIRARRRAGPASGA